MTILVIVVEVIQMQMKRASDSSLDLVELKRDVARLLSNLSQPNVCKKISVYGKLNFHYSIEMQ